MLSEHQKGSQLYAKLMIRFGFLIFFFHPDRKIRENLLTVMENIFQKKNFVHPLGFQQNVIAGTKMGKAKQAAPSCPVGVANHRAEFGSSCPHVKMSCFFMKA